jgi:S1-C subfamily serine protease
VTPRTTLALLRIVDDNALPASPLATAPSLSVGAEIAVAGYLEIGANRLVTTFGRIASLGTGNIEPLWLHVADITIYPGHSGSPVLASTGEVIAVSCGIFQTDGTTSPKVSGGLASLVPVAFPNHLLELEAS